MNLHLQELFKSHVVRSNLGVKVVPGRLFAIADAEQNNTISCLDYTKRKCGKGLGILILETFSDAGQGAAQIQVMYNIIKNLQLPIHNAHMVVLFKNDYIMNFLMRPKGVLMNFAHLPGNLAKSMLQHCQETDGIMASHY